MKRVRVIVEVDVPDDHGLTEKRLVWALKRRLNWCSASHCFSVGEAAIDFRQYEIKEFSRVLQFLPGGVRAPVHQISPAAHAEAGALAAPLSPNAVGARTSGAEA